jgi:hypothetical protein
VQHNLTVLYRTEQLPQLQRKFAALVRLAEQMSAGTEAAMMQDRILGIARGEEDFQ